MTSLSALEMATVPKIMRSPRTVRLEISSKCNLRCLYCYYFDNPAVDYTNLPTEQWLQFFVELGSMAVMDVSLLVEKHSLPPCFQARRRIEAIAQWASSYNQQRDYQSNSNRGIAGCTLSLFPNERSWAISLSLVPLPSPKQKGWSLRFTIQTVTNEPFLVKFIYEIRYLLLCGNGNI